ncbi:MAG: hypothetical protein L6R39_006242 [Caloplaca ligustica]|nr:MAG: hypothetical protein L6R39_006242 [Caloplaca ligustica]
MAPQPSEADIIFNRANVALAKSQRLVASWLPPRTEEEMRTAKTDEEIGKEEQELFTPVPELLGLGAKVPDDAKIGDLSRQKLTSEDLLRRQLLGKGYAKLRNKGGLEQRDPRGTPQLGSKPRPAQAPAKRKVEDVSSDEEGGRSTLGKKRDSKPFHSGNGESDDRALVDDEDHQRESPEVMKHPKKPTNYLDEVLAQRQHKHKSKKKKAARRNGFQGNG